VQNALRWRGKQTRQAAGRSSLANGARTRRHLVAAAWRRQLWAWPQDAAWAVSGRQRAAAAAARLTFRILLEAIFSAESPGAGGTVALRASYLVARVSVDRLSSADGGAAKTVFLLAYMGDRATIVRAGRCPPGRRANTWGWRERVGISSQRRARARLFSVGGDVCYCAGGQNAAPVQT